MEWWEVNRYLAGMHRRYRTPWETTRALQWWLASMFHDPKKGSGPAKPEDMYKFGWEEDAQDQSEAQLTPEEAEKLQQEMSSHRW